MRKMSSRKKCGRREKKKRLEDFVGWSGFSFFSFFEFMPFDIIHSTIFTLESVNFVCANLNLLWMFHIFFADDYHNSFAMDREKKF